MGTGQTLIPTVSDNVNHTKDQSVLRPHGDVTSVGVSGDRSFSRSCRQKFVHLSDASDFVTRGVDGKDEDKYDREEHGSVSAAFARKVRLFWSSWKEWGRTSHRARWLAYHRPRRRWPHRPGSRNTLRSYSSP